MGFNFSEDVLRLTYLYLAECVLGITLFFIFRHFGKVYRRRFLYTWSMSWFAFTVYMGGEVVIALVLPGRGFNAQLLLIITAQLACFLHVILILRGTHELVFERVLKRRQYKGIIAGAVLVAVLTVLAFSQGADSDYAPLRQLLRPGSRVLVMGLGFLFTGVVVFKSHKFAKGFGQRMLATSFVLFSCSQLYYFTVVVLNVYGLHATVPYFQEVIDVSLIAVIGMSMILWLLENERDKLEKANKELDRFLYSTSHDLRAPIASILGLTYLGKMEFQEERARTFMDMIEARIKKLDMVIGDILSLSRSKKVDLKIEELRLKDLLEDAIADIKFNKGASAISLHYESEPGHVFKSDYNQLKIILGNLLSNAVKYHNLNQSQPFIRIHFRRVKEHVEITVEDNGQGIQEESVPRIFEMFYRASLDTEGTGLGLYIVKEALNKLKGNINVQSELGKGSSFTILLDHA